MFLYNWITIISFLRHWVVSRNTYQVLIQSLIFPLMWKKPRFRFFFFFMLCWPELVIRCPVGLLTVFSQQQWKPNIVIYCYKSIIGKRLMCCLFLWSCLGFPLFLYAVFILFLFHSSFCLFGSYSFHLTSLIKKR